ncbi:zinc finger MYND domain-containing protein [Aspergillus mulundensis]|uniref:MYND-type domain-containing protein n=1 Tax=Aspergillus mulundensis TaxID=1810919 RepID=A0A3D8RRE5_9EURO|nr:hypothetical protein DSM5745_06621 [Aspergillus mulundensis]RDW76629.1 hypothetical protein DSM5745_06621 [Aspergillus mulundensis]
MTAPTCALPSCNNPGSKKCSGCKNTSTHYCSATCQKSHWKEHKKTCESAVKANCWVIRPNPILPDADPADDASYIEPLPLTSYGDWGAEMLELESKLTNFSPDEAGKFYSHQDGVDTWYYYAYGGTGPGPENKLASRLIGRKQKGDVAIVRSGPADSNDYPHKFGKADLVATAKFYRTNSPAQVFQEREQSRVFRKMGLGPSAMRQSSETAAMQAKLSELGEKYGFRSN